MNVRKAAWIAVAVGVALVVAALATRSDPESTAERTQRLSRGFACPVCQGESIAASNSSEARAIRVDIARQIEAGATDREITSRFVEDWGREHLLEPSRTGFSALVWVIPVMLVVGAGAMLVLTLRRWTSIERLAASDSDTAIVNRLRADRALRQDEELS